MNVLVLLIPLALILGSCFLFGFLWAVRSGQMDDLETPALRIFNNDKDNTNHKDKADKEKK